MLPLKVISLERSVERRAEFGRRNGHIPYEFFNAIDGLALQPDAISRTGLFQSGLPYRAGAYGAALSHHTLWDEAIRADHPLTVAEDDAIFRLDFARTQAALLHELPTHWDIVLWGWNLNSILAMHVIPGVKTAMYFDYQQLLGEIDTFQKGTPHSRLYRLNNCFGLPAYSISPAGARKLKSLCFPLTRFSLTFPLLGDVPNFGLDVATNRIYADINAFVSFPLLAMTRNDHNLSTIQNSPTPPG
jgi:GR25 family glycosyltransferase involved in LPS biosynthesis